VSVPFAPGYAAVYDALYADKDYAQESDLLTRLFDTYAAQPVKTVLDLGCGTGAHARELVARGYDVVGVDRSEAMLERARVAAPAARFIHGDLQSVDVGHAFDAVVLLFAVLGYQISPAEVLAALRTARRHLNLGGILAFDVWYGPAVLAQRPATRTRDAEIEGDRLVRTSRGVLEEDRQVVTVGFEIEFPDSNAAPIAESHQMRYFFTPELEGQLNDSGFDLVRIGGFPEFDRDPDETTWNVLVVARAR